MQWQPIETAEPLDRLFVAGWQKPHGNVEGYWWVYEDMTDQNGVPINHPDALKWQPLPKRPTEPPEGA